ncbi:T9SS type A sorting domain-containing protein [Fulvivirga sp. RKSG066]|uniref:T9SS type A sorting domain-containing protein n=1 Tax=Fulvivirga aurantia TaxID=2529383 RepID=UPI0012BB8AB7|nr:T9SS type A sorting domain-containing protein [Fulvivirga aurantia]MTI21945.1 T9SS type A sorting domain-containing protein [Fulvivirga aurantia]
MKSLITLAFSLILAINALGQNTYIWNGGEGLLGDRYYLPTNWSPVRALAILANNDVLLFNSGDTVNLLHVQNQTVGALIVRNNTHITMSADSVNKVLNVSGIDGVDVFVENGSSLTLKDNNGVRIDVVVASGSDLEIGGKVTMERGNFVFNGGVMNLHTDISPINVVPGKGKFVLAPATTLAFGKAGEIANGQMVLPNNVFGSAPVIEKMVINSANGVKLGNQPITVTDSTQFINGDLHTNSVGKVIYETTASDPVESTNSKVIGFVEMKERLIGTGGLSFFGYTIETGIDDLGSVSMLRMTGPSGINFNPGEESIAVTWNVTVENQPVSGREISMQWFEGFDNGNDITLPMQMYRFTNGTEWEIVGGATEIASNVNGKRTSATIVTNHFSDWTITSEDSALPVSLVSFSGSSTTNEVILNWTTASELNNERFIVERMVDGEFLYIGNVRGNGTSNEVNNYQFVDDLPANGANYYRLVQQDFDGKQTIHETISVEYTISTDFEVYPNPSTGNQLIVALDSNPSDKASIRLYDAHGTLIIEKLAISTFKVDVLEGKEISKGMYYLEYTNSGESNKRRVMVN